MGSKTPGTLSIDDPRLAITRPLVSLRRPGDWRGRFWGRNHNSGTLSIMDTTCRGNSGFAGSGGIENTGTLLVVDSTLAVNSGGGSGGGAIGNSGNATVSGSTFTDNEADRRWRRDQEFWHTLAR